MYFGPRPEDSNELHSMIANRKGSYPYKFPKHSSIAEYKYTKKLQKAVSNLPCYQYEDEEAPFYGMSPELWNTKSRKLRPNFQDLVVFDSNFESGNLDRAVLVSQSASMQVYDLYTRPDSNTSGYNQWFYFSVEPGPTFPTHCVLQLRIVNLKKGQSLYTQGMKIKCFSKRQNSIDGTEWVSDGLNIKYGPS